MCRKFFRPSTTGRSAFSAQLCRQRDYAAWKSGLGLSLAERGFRCWRTRHNSSGHALLAPTLAPKHHSLVAAGLWCDQAVGIVGGTRPGQALRGSSELHGWGDSNLYLRRHKQSLTLTTEHRAAPSADPFAVQLTESGPALALPVLGATSAPSATTAHTPADRVRDALAGLDRPVPVQQLRKLCAMRTATLCDSLAELTRQGLVVRKAGGYQLRLRLDAGPSATAFPVTHPRDPKGNGNGKHPAPS